MKCSIPALAVCLLVSISGITQVQLDQPLEFTSPGSQSRITGLETVADDHDAANRVYVDTAIVNRSHWIRTNNDIHFSAGKVGVGTVTPQMPLDLSGTLRLTHPWTEDFLEESPAIQILTHKPTILTSDTGSYLGNTKNSYILHHSTGGFRIFNSAQTLIQEPVPRNHGWTERFTIRSNGFTGIGVGGDGATHILHISGQGRSTSSSWATSSDRRVKEEIRSLDRALPTILALRPVEFAWKKSYTDHHAVYKQVQLGFIAQEVEEVAPGMVEQVREVIGDEVFDDFRILNLSDLTPLLVRALQEQQAEIDALRERIEVMESSRKKRRN